MPFKVRSSSGQLPTSSSSRPGCSFTSPFAWPDATCQPGGTNLQADRLRAFAFQQELGTSAHWGLFTQHVGPSGARGVVKEEVAKRAEAVAHVLVEHGQDINVFGVAKEIRQRLQPKPQKQPRESPWAATRNEYQYHQ